MVQVCRALLELIGLLTVVWFVCITREEYIKIRQEQKEKNGQSKG